MADINQCRDLKLLNPLVKTILELALKDIKKQGISPLVIETYRTKERQYYLYGQGRSQAECIKAGIPSDKAKAYARSGAKVTWTLNSIHIQKKAVDIVPQRKNKAGKMEAIWSSQDKQTKKIIAVMEKYGFEAGANWKNNTDSPHFQVKGEFNKYFYKGKSPYYVTKIIQKALNNKGYGKLKVDGSWGAETTQAVNKFRKDNKWIKNGKLGAKGLRKLLV